MVELNDVRHFGENSISLIKRELYHINLRIFLDCFSPTNDDI